MIDCLVWKLDAGRWKLDWAEILIVITSNSELRASIFSPLLNLRYMFKNHTTF